MKNKLTLVWKDGGLIDRSKVFFLDECHGVTIVDYVDRIELKFHQRVKHGDKYYCRTTKTHTLDVKEMSNNLSELNDGK